MHLQCGRLIYKEWENQLSDSVDSATHPFSNWGQLSRVIYHSGPARVLGIRYLEPFWYRYIVFFLFVTIRVYNTLFFLDFRYSVHRHELNVYFSVEAALLAGNSFTIWYILVSYWEKIGYVGIPLSPWLSLIIEKPIRLRYQWVDRLFIRFYVRIPHLSVAPVMLNSRRCRIIGNKYQYLLWVI